MSITTETFFKFKGGIVRNDITEIIHLDHVECSVRAYTRYHNVEDLKGFLVFVGQGVDNFQTFLPDP